MTPPMEGSGCDIWTLVPIKVWGICQYKTYCYKTNYSLVYILRQDILTLPVDVTFKGWRTINDVT